MQYIFFFKESFEGKCTNRPNSFEMMISKLKVLANYYLYVSEKKLERHTKIGEALKWGWTLPITALSPNPEARTPPEKQEKLGDPIPSLGHAL